MRRRFTHHHKNGYLVPMYIDCIDDISISVSIADIEYKIGEEGEWTTLLNGDYTPEIVSGKRVFIKKDNFFPVGSFSITGRFNLGGDCRSLYYGERVLSNSPLFDRCFEHLFIRSEVVRVEKDFLPATTLADACYIGIFRGCTLLQTAPELPATTLADACYSSMFNGCTSLNYIKMLATDISATNCLNYWVNGVSSTGTFVKNSAMTSLPTATSSNDYAGIPSGWTVQNA